MASFVLCTTAGVLLSWGGRGKGRHRAWIATGSMVHPINAEVADLCTVNMSSFEEGLGRVTYVVGALQHLTSSRASIQGLTPRWRAAATSRARCRCRPGTRHHGLTHMRARRGGQCLTTNAAPVLGTRRGAVLKFRRNIGFGSTSRRTTPRYSYPRWSHPQ